MPALFKRDNGVYYVTFADAARTPKRKSVSTRQTTQRAAEKEAKRLEADYLSGRFDPWRGARTARHPSPPAPTGTLQTRPVRALTVGDAVAASARVTICLELGRFQAGTEPFITHRSL